MSIAALVTLLLYSLFLISSPSRVGSTLAFTSNLASSSTVSPSSYDYDASNGNNSINSNNHPPPPPTSAEGNTGSRDANGGSGGTTTQASTTATASTAEGQALLTTLLRNELLGSSMPTNNSYR